MREFMKQCEPCQQMQKMTNNLKVLVPLGNAPFTAKAMKRHGNLYQQICSTENLELADKKARKGKQFQYGIQLFDRNRTANLAELQYRLSTKTYRTSAYRIFNVNDGKERTVYGLPYPDRVAHHAVMNPLEAIFVNTFTADTYSCIKRRGIHAAARALKKALRDENTEYCLKLDIRKFYENIDHDILKELLRKKIKDADLLWLLDEIIDSAPGVPIGNYLSQYFANFYLAYFDHWLKEEKKVTYYFRYADDMVFLAKDKKYLHQLLADVREYLETRLKLSIKKNYQVFPVQARGIDFVGYKFYHTHILLRKSIKQRFARTVALNPNPQSIASYMGWATHCDSGNLVKTLFHEAV